MRVLASLGKGEEGVERGENGLGGIDLGLRNQPNLLNKEKKQSNSAYTLFQKVESITFNPFFVTPETIRFR